MKIYKKNNQTFDRQILHDAAARLKLPTSFVELLYLRGLDTDEKIQKFLHQGSNQMHDPFLMRDMDKVVERLRQAADEGQKVVVYCDYDADGICAGAILSLMMSSAGADVFTYVPSRNGDGYGLHTEPLDKIIEENCPDLILTCDCGISGAAEVEYVQDLGVDIIVTDHHEVPQRLPDCLVLNPHITGCGYPFEHLCGAGVALKIVQAFLGQQAADEYLDMAAIATIADLVPLVDENRLIVQRGLKRLKQRTNLGLSHLLDRLELTSPTSTDIAFKIAPRINAAGRMGEATRALRILISQDKSEIDSILDEIETDNNLRKQVCDQLYNQSIADLSREDLTTRRAIVLSYPDWEKGITGIVAARLAGEFKRPSFIMVRSGSHYKGTARGIEGINVYKILDFASDLLIEFGGHEQAAGFSILEGNIAAFRARVDEYVSQFDSELFMPSCGFDLQLDESELTEEFVRALDLLEPFGNGNSRPLFCIKTRIFSVVPLKSNPIHTQITTASRLNLMAFSFSHKNQILLGDEEKSLVIEAQIGAYGVRGLLRQACGQKLYVNDPLAKANFIKMMGAKTGGKEAKFSTFDGFSSLGCDMYGTLFIAGCHETLESFLSQAKKPPMLHEFIYSTVKNNYSRVMVSPDFDDNLLLPLYDKIVFLDSPISRNILDFLSCCTKAQIFVPKTADHTQFLSGLDLSRDCMIRYFEAIRRGEGTANSLYSFYHGLSKQISGLEIRQFVVALMVFRQLGILETSKVGGFSVTVSKGKKAELADSEIYRILTDKLSDIPQHK